MAGFDKVVLRVSEFHWDFRGSGQGGFDLTRVEPFFLGVTADAHGNVFVAPTPIGAQEPRVGRRRLHGIGHVCYGPADPGNMMLFTGAIVESDHDIRAAGRRIQALMGTPDFQDASRAAGGVVRSTLSAASASSAVGTVVQGALQALEELVQLAATSMAGNPDDIMFVDSGAFPRDITPPYLEGRQQVAASRQTDGEGRPRFGFTFEVLRLGVDAVDGEVAMAQPLVAFRARGVDSGARIA